MEGVTLSPLAVERVDSLRELWLALHHRHQAVSPVPLVEDDARSWQARRAVYTGRLAEGSAFGIVAELGSAAVGYAFCCLHPGPDDTFPVGAQYADLYSLSVAEAVRGRGIGTRLLDAVDRELEERDVHDLRISVLAGNERAQRLYERRGLRVAELVLFRFGSPTGRHA
ncbi:MAG: GNAT family N-acetyltransferase [Gaiellales bacterium]